MTESSFRIQSASLSKLMIRFVVYRRISYEESIS